MSNAKGKMHRKVYTEAEMLHYMREEYTLADESFEDLLHDYLLMVGYFDMFDNDVIAYRLELKRRGCLFVYTPDRDQRFAKYEVYYGGSRPGWETAYITDMPEKIDYLVGGLLLELARSEYCAEKFKITIYEWTDEDNVKVSQLPVAATVVLDKENVIEWASDLTTTLEMHQLLME